MDCKSQEFSFTILLWIQWDLRKVVHVNTCTYFKNKSEHFTSYPINTTLFLMVNYLCLGKMNQF